MVAGGIDDLRAFRHSHAMTDREDLAVLAEHGRPVHLRTGDRMDDRAGDGEPLRLLFLGLVVLLLLIGLLGFGLRSRGPVSPATTGAPFRRPAARARRRVLHDLRSDLRVLLLNVDTLAVGLDGVCGPSERADREQRARRQTDDGAPGELVQG